MAPKMFNNLSSKPNTQGKKMSNLRIKKKPAKICQANYICIISKFVSTFFIKKEKPQKVDKSKYIACFFLF